MNITVTYKSGTVISVYIPDYESGQFIHEHREGNYGRREVVGSLVPGPITKAAEEPKAEPIQAPEQPIQVEDAPIQEQPALIEDDSLMRFPCVDGEYVLAPQLLNDFRSCFGATFADAELAKARMWCITNERMRKTRRGMGRYLNAWLCRAKGEKRTPLQQRGSLLDAPASNQDGW